MKILIIVPAYNESASIPTVINELQKNGYRDILVIDDGSTDKTGLIAKKTGVTVLRHVLNRGLGAGLATGFAFAKKNRYDIAITFDADGQHIASDIHRLIEPIISCRADVVIGSRLLKSEGMPKDRLILNKISNFLTWLLYGVKTTDSQSGLRAFNAKAIACIDIHTDRMEVSSEFFKEIKKNHLKYKEIPIRAIYTDYSRKSGQSNLNAFSVGFKMVLRLFR